MTNHTDINSDSYWDKRFSENWESLDGPKQSQFFARLAIEHLPTWLMDQIRRERLKVADWGCAQGDGTAIWANYIDTHQLVGVDFSSVATRQASHRYPVIRFVNEDWLNTKAGEGETFDIIFSSNTLEHFHNPYETLLAVAGHASKAIVLALPYRECDRIEEHFFSFLPDNIPLVLKNGFRLVWSRVVDCRTRPNSLWGGDQIILCYADPHWLDSIGLILKDMLIEQEDTESQLASLRQLVTERDGQIVRQDAHIQELAREVVRQDEHAQDLAREIAMQDAHAQDLAHEVARQDALAQDLAREVARQDALAQDLAREVAQQDAHSQELARELVKQDAHSQELTRELVKQDAHSQELTRELVKQDARERLLLAELGQAREELDELARVIRKQDAILMLFRPWLWPGVLKAFIRSVDHE